MPRLAADLAQTIQTVVDGMLDDPDAKVRGYATFLRARQQRLNRI